jgi:hypothetical protein
VDFNEAERVGMSGAGSWLEACGTAGRYGEEEEEEGG